MINIHQLTFCINIYPIVSNRTCTYIHLVPIPLFILLSTTRSPYDHYSNRKMLFTFSIFVVVLRIKLAANKYPCNRVVDVFVYLHVLT